MAPVSTGADSFSLTAPARAVFSAEQGSAQLLEPPEACVRVGWEPMKSGSLSALHSDPGCAEDRCSSIGIWMSRLQRALVAGLSGQSARPLVQGRSWARPCTWGMGGKPQQRWGARAERVSGQGKQGLGCVGAMLPVLLGAE